MEYRGGLTRVLEGGMRRWIQGTGLAMALVLALAGTARANSITGTMTSPSGTRSIPT